MKGTATCLAAVVAAVALGAWMPAIKPIVNPPIKSAGLEADEQAAGASILGQFRTSSAAWIYKRTDLYLHNGVELRPLSEQEIRAGRSGVGVDRNSKKLLGDEENLVTTIPGADRDFRGIFGDLERETGPYKDMHRHTHNAPESTLPLFRLMTWVDPQFIVGWTTGAMILNDHTPEGTRKALAFLKEGLRENPDSIELLTRVGVVTATDLKDIPGSLRWFSQGYQIGMQRREHLSDEGKEALLDNMRWVAIVCARLGRTGDVRRVVEQGIRMFPDDQVMLRYAVQLGIPH